MITAVDTNVFCVLWAGLRESSPLAIELDRALRAGRLAVCPAVYAELLANPKMSEGNVQEFFRKTGTEIQFAMTEDVWVEAGRRFAAYAKRRRKAGGGEPKRLLADFVIGAHALLMADRLMTLDRSRYERYFPELKLI